MATRPRPGSDKPRLSARNDLREFDGRLRGVMALFVAAFGLLFWRLWDLQVVRGAEFYRVANNNFVRDVEIASERGLILDARLEVVAENRPSYDVFVTPQIFRDDEAALSTLSRLLSLSLPELERLRASLSSGHRADIAVRRDITRDQLAEIETARNAMPGMYVRVSRRRHYPFGELAAHLVGYMSEVTDEELEDLDPFGYHPGDYVGRTGLERAFEAVLRGAPGLDRQVVDAHGDPQPEQVARQLLGDYRRVEPIPGRTLRLTVDMRLQAIVDEAAADAVSGGIVAVDPRDGSVLAILSKPGFNPNAWSGRLSEQEKRESDNDPFHPMLDKSVMSWFPGSTYKVITAIAALEEGLIDSDDVIDCPGFIEYGNRTFRCWNRGGHGPVDLRRALMESCDVYFYQLGLQLGIDRLASYASELGFGERPGLGFNGESAGVLPTREWHEENSPGGFQYGFTVNTSVGQGDVRVSPLQLALAYAAIANGGTLYYPRIVDRVTTGEGETLFEYPRRVRRELPFSREHVGSVIDGLEAVLQDEDGTAHDWALPYVHAAGKTGTAQVRALETVRLEGDEVYFRDRDHAWFVAFAPVESPRIVVAVFLEHGGQGSRSAAPIAMRIIDGYFREVLGTHDQIEAALASGDTDALAALWRTSGPPGASTALPATPDGVLGNPIGDAPGTGTGATAPPGRD